MEPRSIRTLVADDEPSIRLVLGDVLQQEGHDVVLAQDGREAIALLESQRFDVIVSDIRMPHVDGFELFKRAKVISPGTDFILMTAYAEVTDAVSALKEGVTDYLVKPVDPAEIKVRIARIAEARALRRELDSARELLERAESNTKLIGKSLAMKRLRERIEAMADSDAPVMIVGETGTGKEVVAKELHARSSRRDGPFIAVNCAAFPETLLEAELFGHEAGAFTGAVRAREGRFRAAHGGTLLLDEIGEVTPTAQAKLLRVLQEGTIEPLGTERSVNVDVRVLSATHRNLKQRIADGHFREDLFYRLNVLDIGIAPLRERRDDIPLLVQFFLDRLVAKGEREKPTISPRAWAALSKHDYPGNIRELEHAIERSLVLCRGPEIDLMHLPEDISKASADAGDSLSERGVQPLGEAAKAFEREYLVRTLEQYGGKKGKAAEALGISRKNLWEKLRAHGIGTGDG